MSVVCPACGEEDALHGRRQGETIAVTCQTCSTEWIRDPNRPTCSRCGGDDIASAPKAIVEKSRGTQLSVLGTTTILYCRSCDREELDAYLAAPGGRLVMPTDLPTTTGDRDHGRPSSAGTT